jgi:C-terminal processing protease CtpA/Prc
MEALPAMRNARFAIFGLVLTGLVAAAVSGLVAQTRSEPRPPDWPRPRVMMLDGRGGQLGVIVEDLDAEGLKAAAGAPSGVRIEDVDQDSPAAKAGLREGDIVVDVDGDRVRSARQFSRLIQETPEGRSVALGIVRDGKRQTVSVTPESRAFAFDMDADRIGRDVARGLREIEPRLRELEPRLREVEPRLKELEPRLREFRFDRPFSFDFDMMPRMTGPRGRLGVQLNELSSQLADYFGAAEGGVLVSSVTKDSAAEKAGIKAGDVITSINGDHVRGTEDLIDELRGVSSGEVTIGIIRDKKASSVKATIQDVRPARPPGRPI